jgi:hypothetical protein
MGGRYSTVEATDAIGTNVMISPSASNAVAVSASKNNKCATTEPGSLALCADTGVDVLNATMNRSESALREELLWRRGGAGR